MRVPFGEWMPDRPVLDNPGATEAKNVIPYAQSYAPLLGLSDFSGVVSSASRVFNSVWAVDSAGTFYNHCGTATRLEELQTVDQTWDNVSIAGNYTGATNWEWAQIGNRLIAVDIANVTQYFDLGTSTLYANLAGSPPKAKTIGTIRNFVVMGNVDDGTAYPSRLVWSGYNNSEQWTPSRATQSDVRDLRGSYGPIEKIVPGQYGVVFQSDAISVMRYTGPPAIFTIDVVEKGRGTYSPKSVTWIGQNIFYLGTDGFYVFNPGGGSQPIGNQKVDRWFFNEVDISAIDEVVGVADPREKTIFWAFPSSSTLGYNDKMIIYNWGANRWSHAEVNTSTLVEYLSTPVTLDGLSSFLADIDSASIPVDSQAYADSRIALMAFDTSHRLATFAGTALTATIETVEFGEDRRLLAVEARPLISGATQTTTLAHGCRNAQSDAISWKTGKAATAKGTMNFRNDARYNRIRASIAGGFENAIGVDVNVRQGGAR